MIDIQMTLLGCIIKGYGPLMETDAHVDRIPANASDNDGASDLAGGAERAATGDPLCNGRKLDGA
ncbi:MAG: hypothetical protein OXF62_11535 [Caldilineaceae bacterium]|nr:hypothetical protein [Caldilineaceae bacterium]